MAYRVTQLPEGLTVATAAMPHMTSVSLGLWVGVGGRYEPAEWNGASHFIEHMLFKGTRRRSALEISQAVEGIGGYLNAFTGEESTCFYSRARHDRFGELLDVLADMVLHSRFDPAEIDKERGVIKEELAMYLDQPQHHVQELLNELLWPGHPLGRPLTGTVLSLDRLDRAALTGFLRSHYVAGSTLIAAAGRITHAEVLRAVRPLARRFPAGPRPACVPVVSNQSKPALRLFTKATEQTQLALAFRACSRHDPRRYALRVLNTLLGENMSSRLFQKVREERGLAYSVYSSLSYFDDAGALVISAGLDEKNLVPALRLILQELGRLARRPPSPAELRRARDYLIGQVELSLESTESQMNWVGEQWLGFAQIFSAQTVKQRIARVRASDVTAAARDFLRPEHLNLALVTPLKNSSPVDRVLRSWRP